MFEPNELAKRILARARARGGHSKIKRIEIRTPWTGAGEPPLEPIIDNSPRVDNSIEYSTLYLPYDVWRSGTGDAYLAERRKTADGGTG